MVEEKQPDSDDAATSVDASDKTSAGADWGEDWESAFQAEEFLFSDDPQPESSDGSSTGYDFTPSGTGTFGDLPDFDGGDSDEPDSSLADEEALDGTATTDTGASLLARLQQKVATLPTKAWLLITGTLTLLFVGTLLFQIFSSHPDPAPIQVATDTEVTHQPTLLSEPTAATEPMVNQVKKEEAPLVIPPQVEKDRAKWKLTPFLIPATDTESGETSFITVELTLIALVDAGTDFPEDQKPFIRDMIFQFFANRPYYELRRYSLARGEMSAKLLEWLRREWQAGEVASLLFHTYKIG